MIKTIEKDGFRHNYSDLGFQIRKTGTNEIYEETYDIINSMNIYEETDIVRTAIEEELESLT